MKFISKTLISLLVVLVAIGTVGAKPQDIKEKTVSQIATENYLSIQKNEEISDEEKIKETINTYFVTRYEGQTLLEEQDFSTVVDDTQDWVKKEKDKREIELYVASLFDLSYQSYSFEIVYDSIVIKNNKATVQLLESHEVVFNAIAPDISKLGDLPHTIILHKKGERWIIYKDEYEDELSQLLKHQTKDEIKNQVDKNYEEDKKRANTPNSSKKAFALRIYKPTNLTNYSYNRTNAVTYANIYWQYYNVNWYKTYPGNDCTNFVSQAMYAGEGYAPPSTGGMTTSSSRNYNTDWYYIFNNPMATQNGDGSLPWVRVQTQYNFITGNTNKIGPYGFGTTNLCSATTGDIVQLYNVSGQGIWDHEGIIVYAGNCGSLSNYKVNAHTTNRYQYPLSNWATYSIRYIHINGWRGN